MNIGADVQAEMLFRSFKETSVVPEVPAEPPPTPGDLVRGVAEEINGSREADVEAAAARAEALWQVNPNQKEAPQ